MSPWAKVLIPVLVVELLALAYDIYQTDKIIHKVEIVKCQD